MCMAIGELMGNPLKGFVRSYCIENQGKLKHTGQMHITANGWQMDGSKSCESNGIRNTGTGSAFDFQEIKRYNQNQQLANVIWVVTFLIANPFHAHACSGGMFPFEDFLQSV